MQKIAEEKTEPSLLDKMLGVMGLNMPDDATCFIKTDIQVPLHWVSTRWLIDIEGKNVFKCLSEPEKPMAEPKKKKGEFKIDVK